MQLDHLGLQSSMSKLVMSDVGWCWRPKKLGTVMLIGTLSILAASSLASAQEPEKVPSLGYMSPGNIPRYDNAFLQGLQKQGYILPGEIPRYDDALWQGLVKRGSFEGRKTAS